MSKLTNILYGCARQILKAITYTAITAAVFVVVVYIVINRKIATGEIDMGLRNAVEYVGEQNDTVVVISLARVGTDAYYQKLGDYISYMHSRGYATLTATNFATFAVADSLPDNPTLTQVQVAFDAVNRATTDVGARKQRKIRNSLLGWASDANDNADLPSRFRNAKYTPFSFSKVGLTTDVDYWIGTTDGDYIAHYEQKYGTIVLNDYDATLPLGEPYKWQSDSLQYKYSIMTGVNIGTMIVDRIRLSGLRKVVVFMDYADILAVRDAFDNSRAGFERNKRFRVPAEYR